MIKENIKSENQSASCLEYPQGLAEPGSQLTSALNRNKIQSSKKTEAQMHTQEEEKRYFYAMKGV